MIRCRLIFAFRVCVLLALAFWYSAEAMFLIPLGLMVCVPCLTPPCTIFTDDFSTDRTGTDYTAVSGSFSVAAGVITTTSSGAIIVETTSGTFGHGSAQVRAKLTNSATTARVIGSYVDSSNFVYAELTINGASSALKLFKRVSGSDTQLGSTLTFTGSTGTFYTIRVCWDGALAIATSPTLNIATTGAYTGTGNEAGFGASPGAGTATFDDFTFSNIKSDSSSCNDCTYDEPVSCSICLSGNYPQFLKLVVAGVTNDACTACATLNGTWIIGSGDSTPPVCSRSYTDACSQFGSNSGITPCSNIAPGLSSGTIFRVIWFRNGTDYYVQVIMETPTNRDPSYTGPSLEMAWIASLGTFASPPDCFALIDGLALAFDCRFNTSGSQKCTGTGSTVTVYVL